MRSREQKNNIKRLMANDNTLQTLFQIFKKKDYNKILHRIRTYQSLILFLQTPTISDVRELQKAQANLRDIQFNIRQIGLSIDQISDDCQSLGFSVISQTLDTLMDSFRILHQNLIRQSKDNLYNTRLGHFNFKKRSNNICDECSQMHQATHLKRLKTSFGMSYPQFEQQRHNLEKLNENEDLTLKQKQDFIDQLNYLLDKRPQITNLTINTKKYKQLVDCLSKMQKLDLKFEKKLIIKQQDDNEQILKDKYKQIIQQIKNILNIKFRQGYSQRIKNMLDKFQIVLKSDQIKKIEKKNLINMIDHQLQTDPTIQFAQIIILKQQINKLSNQIIGLKQGRKKIQEKYLKLLQIQRKISRQSSSLSAQNDRLIHQLEIKQKLIDQLQQTLGKNKQQKHKKFDIKKLHKENIINPIIIFKPLDSNRNNIKKISPQESIKITDRSQKHSETQTDLLNPIQSINSQVKKRNFKMMKRFSIIPNSHQISITEAQDRKFIISHTFDLVIQPSKVSHQQSPKLLQQIQPPINNEPKIMKKVSKQTKKNKKPQKTPPKKKKSEPKTNKPNQSLKLKQSIQLLQKQQKDEIIMQKSQAIICQSQSQISLSINDRSESRNHRSSIFNPKKRESRDFKNINLIRLTQLPKQFRLNYLKTQNSKSKDESGIVNHLTRQKQSIIRINKYEKKNSNTLDKDKVRQIVNLLKIQKQTFSRKKSLKPIINSERNEIDEQKYKPSQFLLQTQQKEKQQQKQDIIQQKQDVTQIIQNLKILIQCQYTYLKASGFINFLLNFQKKPSLVNRNLIKYKFQFTHLTQNQLYLFGGIQQMIKFTKNYGIWQKYLIDQNDLKLYYKHINFAHKISKYFLLLKKMNTQYFQQYIQFIIDPLNYSLTHFNHSTIDTINQLFPQPERERQERDILPSNEVNWKKIMMRLIRFHHQVHKGCKHIVQFLDKIGYYRYSI